MVSNTTAPPLIGRPPGPPCSTLIGRTATLSGLRTLLGALDDSHLQAMFDTGKLSWVINVAGERAAARDLRVPLCCVVDLLRNTPRDYTLDQMTRYLFGDSDPVTAQRFYCALNLKHSTFYSLVAGGAIRLARGSRPRRGPGGSALITRADVANFLLRRRVL